MKRERSHKRKPRRLGAGLSGSLAAPAAALPPGRLWLFRFLAVVIVPLILFGGLELLLRLLGFGFDPHFLKPAQINGKDCYVANDDFGLRFFPRRLARIPDPVVVPAAKAADTFRIFIFGESAALGDPRPNYGAGCYLETLLAERFPQAKFEVINTSITAINSHVILPIAKECAEHKGDLWLIYMGNNEMVGPFGAATVFGARAPPLWLARARLQFRRLRLGQLLAELGQKVQKNSVASAGWGGMEMFVQNQVPPNDARKERVYRNFERNLNDILTAGLACGARVILSTVAVNQKDCPPFGTLADFPGANHQEFDRLCADGAAAEAQGRFADAQLDYERATRLCPDAAEAQFRLGRCLLHATNTAATQLHFLRAVDADTLPFRADSRINSIIRAAARQSAGESLVLCDADAALSAASPEGICGEESFYEHVHLNPPGNYALALAWAGQVEKLLNPALKRGARSAWATQSECEQLLGLTDWNRVSILEEILRRLQQPPFSGQTSNAQRLGHLRDQIAQMRAQLTNEAAAQAREIYLRALRREPQNFRLHENYAEFLEAMHELKPAIAERKKVCELVPNHYFPFYALGADLKDAGALDEAYQALRQAQTLRPEQPLVRLELGMTCARQGQWDAACLHLEAARELNPQDPRAALYLGEVLWKLDRRSEALASLREAIRLAPSDWQAHYRLASDLSQLGQFAHAALEYQEALHLNPASVKTKVGLAAALLNVGRKPEALQQVDEALQLDPNDPKALELRQKFREK